MLLLLSTSDIQKVFEIAEGEPPSRDSICRWLETVCAGLDDLAEAWSKIVGTIDEERRVELILEVNKIHIGPDHYVRAKRPPEDGEPREPAISQRMSGTLSEFYDAVCSVFASKGDLESRNTLIDGLGYALYGKLKARHLLGHEEYYNEYFGIGYKQEHIDLSELSRTLCSLREHSSDLREMMKSFGGVDATFRS